MGSKKTIFQKLFAWITASFYLVISFLLILNRGMLHPYYFDEDHFVGGAYLFAKHGLLPYLDFAYFHAPNLIFIYGALFKLTNYYLLTARAFSVMCGFMALLAIFIYTHQKFHKETNSVRVLMAIATTAILLGNKIYSYVTGQTWNHDLSILFTILALITFLNSAKRIQPLPWIAASGFLLGLSIGTRSSYATAIPAFLIAIWLHPMASDSKDKFKQILCFGIGGVIAMLPSIILFAIAPEQFIFNNITHAHLNMVFHEQRHFLTGLIGVIYNSVTTLLTDPSNLLISVAGICFTITPALQDIYKKKNLNFERTFLALVLILITVGALMPSPIFPQYFFAPIVLSVFVTTSEIARNDWLNTSKSTLLKNLFILLVIGSTLPGFMDVWKIGTMRQARENWYPLILHEQVQSAFANLGEGDILTLSSTVAMEAGKEIYPEFATGTFPFRAAELVSNEDRRKFVLLSNMELYQIPIQNQPTAILTADNLGEESCSLEKYAISIGYKKTDIDIPSFPFPTFHLWKQQK
jgi:4-amino-4-deoxy-L-arabinose transferase-like glycosyltransferase